MTVSEKMKSFRTSNGYSIKDMNMKSGVSETLLSMIENGMVTHPKIARNIANAYGLTDEEMMELTPENRNPVRSWRE